MPNTTRKYLSLEKLGLYDEKIKKFITDADGVVLDSAKAYADGLADNYEAAGNVASAKSELQGKINGVEAKADAAQAAADAAQGEVDALETYVGTIPTDATATNVVAYVQEKTAHIATDSALNALTTRVETAEGAIDAIEADYLKEEDKTALNDLITAEKERAEGIEGGLRTDVNAIKGDYLKAADKEALQGGIDTNAQAIAAIKEDVDAFFADADMTASAKDTLKELQEYIASDETGAAAMTASIQQNTTDITAVKGRLDTAEGKISTLEGEMDTAQSNISTLQAAIADGGSVDVRIDALEAAIGESGSVADDIEAAKNAAIEAAAADATSKANTAETNAKGYADGLNATMSGRVDALEAIDHDHSNKAELDLIVSGDKAKWDAAAAIAHSHDNKTVLDGITAAKVTAWDAAEQNAKTFAQGLNDTMAGRMDAVEAWQTNMVEISEGEINALFSTNA